MNGFFQMADQRMTQIFGRYLSSQT